MDVLRAVPAIANAFRCQLAKAMASAVPPAASPTSAVWAGTFTSDELAAVEGTSMEFKLAKDSWVVLLKDLEDASAPYEPAMKAIDMLKGHIEVVGSDMMQDMVDGHDVKLANDTISIRKSRNVNRKYVFTDHPALSVLKPGHPRVWDYIKFAFVFVREGTSLQPVGLAMINMKRRVLRKEGWLKLTQLQDGAE